MSDLPAAPEDGNPVPAVPTGFDVDRDVVTVILDESVPAMREVALTAMQGPPCDVVIDLRAATVMSHQELALLVGVRARQQSRGRKLTLVCGRDSATEQALSRAGMRSLFTTVTALPGARERG
jgi:anti-anti-sigma regulatory factor